MKAVGDLCLERTGGRTASGVEPTHRVWASSRGEPRDGQSLGGVPRSVTAVGCGSERVGVVTANARWPEEHGGCRGFPVVGSSGTLAWLAVYSGQVVQASVTTHYRTPGW